MVRLAQRSALVAGLLVVGAIGGCAEEGADETTPSAEQELGACAKCTVVAANLHFDRRGGITTDGTTIAWFDEQAGYRIWTIGTDGSNLHGVETCRGNHRLPKLHQKFAYFDTCGGASCQLNRFPLDAVAKSCEVVLPGVDGARNGFLIDASNNELYAQSSEIVPKLQRVDLATLNTTTIPNVPWSFQGSYVDDTGIYGNVNASGGSATNSIVHLDGATFQTTRLATNVMSPNGTGLAPQVLFADASDVYYFAGGGLYRAARAGGAAVRITGPDSAWDIRRDGSNVVWYQLDKPNIYRMPIKGGPVTTISTGTFNVRGLTFDSKRYYFMETARKIGFEAGPDWTLRAIPK